MESTRSTPPHQPDGDVDPVIVLSTLNDPASTSDSCELVRSLVLDGGVTVVTCDVEEISGSAPDVVDTLARMQLIARRCGGQIRLRGASGPLIAILELVGLTEVLPLSDRPGPEVND